MIPFDKLLSFTRWIIGESILLTTGNARSLLETGRNFTAKDTTRVWVGKGET